jgi:hypothetical protein
MGEFRCVVDHFGLNLTEQLKSKETNLKFEGFLSKQLFS